MLSAYIKFYLLKFSFERIAHCSREKFNIQYKERLIIYILISGCSSLVKMD